MKHSAKSSIVLLLPATSNEEERAPLLEAMKATISDLGEDIDITDLHYRMGYLTQIEHFFQKKQKKDL